MPHLHVSKHTGRVTPYVHVPHRHQTRMAIPVAISPSAPAYVRTSSTPAVVVERKWSCARALAHFGASVAIIAGVAAAIIGVVLLSPVTIVIGAAVVLGGTILLPISHRYHLI